MKRLTIGDVLKVDYWLGDDHPGKIIFGSVTHTNPLYIRGCYGSEPIEIDLDIDTIEVLDDETAMIWTLENL